MSFHVFYHCIKTLLCDNAICNQIKIFLNSIVAKPAFIKYKYHKAESSQNKQSNVSAMSAQFIALYYLMLVWWQKIATQLIAIQCCSSNSFS